MNSLEPLSWYQASSPNLTVYPQLQGDRHTDVCVIGAGLTGLSAAVALRDLGLSVIVLEAKTAGYGASGRNGGHVGVGQRRGQIILERWLGLEHAKALWQLGLDAVDLVSHLVTRFDIECELKTGNLYASANPKLTANLQREAEHLQTVYGYTGARYLSPQELRQETQAKGLIDGVLDSNAKHLHPLKYVQGLANAAAILGSELYENTQVTHIQQQADTVNVTTEHGRITANKLVLACNAYLEHLEPRIADKVMPINNYMIATEPLSEEMARSITRSDLAIADSQFVVNYWKLSADNRLLFGGGETYSRDFPEDIKTFVQPHLLSRYPRLAQTRITHGWGGTLAITRNRLPHIGHIKQQIYYAQGFSGHGISIGTLAGKLMAQAIAGQTEGFEKFGTIPIKNFPGGPLLKWPTLVAGMLFYSLKDKLSPKVRSLV
ncbi:MAG: FAD-binding oxidoreductase [Halieaceae bacterium]|nr:FAD-binding oxidoreductase [Halieaceae bacterium]